MKANSLNDTTNPQSKIPDLKFPQNHPSARLSEKSEDLIKSRDMSSRLSYTLQAIYCGPQATAYSIIRASSLCETSKVGVGSILLILSENRIAFG
jgi:hypothetical protein